MFNGFADLNDDLSGAGTPKAKAERPTFPCQSCAGTGHYRGARVHQEKAHCFACGGKGFFYTSVGDRMKAKADAVKRKTNKLQVLRDAFDETNPGFYAILVSVAEWADMGRSIKEQLDTKGTLSERQVSAIRAIHAKAEATRAARNVERQAEQASRTAEVNLSAINSMFDKAIESGLKKLAYRAEGLKLTPAKATSSNPGAIYVTSTEGEYMGKVVGNKFVGMRGIPADIKTKLEAIAENPAEAARAYGKATGICCCCGRELTDPNSIAAGIGPICAGGWGF